MGTKNIEKIMKDLIGEEAFKEQKEKEGKLNEQLNRNLKGIELEKSGKTDEAIKLYEQNIKEDFIGDHPYNRLAIIYRKRNQIKEEIRILKKAIWVFENIVSKARADKEPKLNKFKEKLKKQTFLKI